MRKSILLLLFIISFSAYSGDGRPRPDLAIIEPVPTAPSRTSREVVDVQTILKNSGSSINLGLNMGLSRDNALLDFNFCDSKASEVCDTTATPVPKDYLDFLSSFSSFKKSDSSKGNSSAIVSQQCGCLYLKLSRDNPDFDNQRKASEQRTREIILDAFGKKFINDFSMNIEDTTFFLNRTAVMFENQEKAKEYQCNDVEKYNSAIKTACPNADQAVITARKNKLINALSNGEFTFDQGIGVISRLIMGARIRSDFSETDGQIYARNTYDELRLGLAVSDPQSKLVNVMMSQLLRNSSFKGKLSSEIGTGKSPLEALVKVIEENKSSKEFKDLSLGVDAEKFLKDRNTTLETLKFMMKVHPGFFLAMKDKKVFNNLALAYENNPQHGLIEALRQKGVIEPVLNDNCNKMVAEFAKAVCVKEEDIVKNMDPVDLNLLLNAGKQQTGDRKPDMTDLMVCEAKQSDIDPAKRFSELANLFDKRLNSASSDFYQRSIVKDTGKEAKDAFSGVAAIIGSGNVESSSALGQLSEVGRKLSTSVSGDGVIATQVQAENVLAGKDMKVGSGSMSRETARKVVADNRIREETRAAQRDAIAQASKETQPKVSDSIPQVQEVQAPVTAPVTVPQTQFTPVAVNQNVAPVNSTADQAREALKQYIADKNDAATANEVVSKLDDASAIELNKLRQQNLDLLEKTLKLETDKFDEMKKKISELEKTVPPVVANSPAAEEKPENSLSNLHQSFGGTQTSRSAVQTPSRSIASVSGQFSTSNGSSSVSSSEPQSNGRGQKSVSEAARETSGLIVSTYVPGKPSEVQQQEVKAEVQKLLESTNLNQSSLEEIKTKGFLYRYTVVENNQTVQKEVLIKFESLDKAQRDAIELKLTRKTAENQVSKLSVLRMLIRQNQRL